MFIAPAYAQAAAPAAGGDLFTAMVPMIAIVGIFYLLLIRPQQKKARSTGRSWRRSAGAIE